VGEFLKFFYLFFYFFYSLPCNFFFVEKDIQEQVIKNIQSGQFNEESQ